MINIVTNGFPSTVNVGGKQVQINIDFRVGIEIEKAVIEDKLTPEMVMNAYYGSEWPEPYDDAVNMALWFFLCGKDDKSDDESETAQKLKRKKRSYDYDIDSDALYTSFLQAYDMDITKDKLHWWEFRTLMIDLPDETPFKRRVYYRTVSLSGLSKNERKRIEKMRKHYEIKENSQIDKKMTLEERNEMMKRYVQERIDVETR